MQITTLYKDKTDYWCPQIKEMPTLFEDKERGIIGVNTLDLLDLLYTSSVYDHLRNDIKLSFLLHLVCLSPVADIADLEVWNRVDSCIQNEIINHVLEYNMVVGIKERADILERIPSNFKEAYVIYCNRQYFFKFQNENPKFTPYITDAEMFGCIEYALGERTKIHEAIQKWPATFNDKKKELANLTIKKITIHF